MEKQAFKRSRAMFAAISAIIASNASEFMRQALIGQLGPYRSRGKGRGTAIRNFHKHTTTFDRPLVRQRPEGRAATRRRKQDAKLRGME